VAGAVERGFTEPVAPTHLNIGLVPIRLIEDKIPITLVAIVAIARATLPNHGSRMASWLIAVPNHEYCGNGADPKFLFRPIG
jgi:hypothetical protein